MFSRLHLLRVTVPMLAIATFLCGGASASMAQGTNLNIELHANENVNATSMGLPIYPNARPYKETKSDSAVDMGLSFGSFHFRLMATKYITNDSPDQVLDFYRKPLARYGEVLECEHGMAVGAVKVAQSGLTCSDSLGHRAHIDADERSHRELRSGTPTFYRIVAIDASRTDATHFAIVQLEVPKDDSSDQ